MTKEVWKLCDGYEGRYEVSSLGRVRSLSYNGGRRSEPKMMTLRRNKGGYLKVKLTSSPYVSTWVSVHRVVARAFVDGCAKELHVNHKDGNKENNTPSNLEWCTQQQNNAHALENGLLRPQRGDSNGSSKLNSVQVINIRHAKGAVTAQRLAELYNVSKPLIHSIHLRRSWSHL